MKTSRAVLAAERYLARVADLQALVADIDEAPNRILDELSAALYSKRRTIAQVLTEGELAYVVGRTTGLDPSTLTPVSWFGGDLRDVVLAGGAMGLDLMYIWVWHPKAGRYVRVPVVVRASGYPGREVNYRISYESDWVLTWLFHEGVLACSGAPVLLLHDNATGNESDALLLACGFQGSIPVACRHPAENTTEDSNRRTRDWQPASIEVPTWRASSPRRVRCCRPSSPPSYASSPWTRCTSTWRGRFISER